MTGKDLKLESIIKDLIKKEGHYLNGDFILQKLSIPYGRSYLSYRGIDITEVNESQGFTRRPTKLYAKKDVHCGWTKESLESHIKSEILKQKRYIPLVEFCRCWKGKPKLGPHAEVYRYLKVSVHDINAKLGYIKTSPKEKINKPALIASFTKYILEKDRYISQIELAEKFGVSIGFLTKSSIDTLRLNYDLGYKKGYSYMEQVAYDCIASFGVKEIIRQKTFNDCISEKGIRLKFDLFLPEYNLLIELDGPQHYDKTHVYWTKEGVERDNVKNLFVKRNNLNLLRISFAGKFKTTQIIKQKILETLESLSNHNIVGNDRCDGLKIDEIRQPAAELRTGEGSTSSESVVRQGGLAKHPAPIFG